MLNQGGWGCFCLFVFVCFEEERLGFSQLRAFHTRVKVGVHVPSTHVNAGCGTWQPQLMGTAFKQADPWHSLASQLS